MQDFLKNDKDTNIHWIQTDELGEDDSFDSLVNLNVFVINNGIIFSPQKFITSHDTFALSEDSSIEETKRK